MKKILLSAAMMVAAVSFASAQWFVGGNVGFESSKVDGAFINSDDASEVKTTSYTIIPKFGYIFNESWMVGLGVGYTNTENKLKMLDGSDQKITENMFIANPYVRYTAWQVGRFSLAFQGDVNVGFGEVKDGEMKFKTMEYGVNIAPVVQFDLTCNVLLESKFNFASLGYNYSQIKVEGQKSKASGFNFGANSDNAFTTGDVEVGFIVKF